MGSGKEPSRFARRFAQNNSKQPVDANQLASMTDPDLARLVEAWPTLPEPIRRAMVALVGDK